MRSFYPFVLFLLLCCLAVPISAQSVWHGIERILRYTPEGESFVIRNGERRFNRALYGGPSGFRVEAGDLPEFGLYRPRLAGTLRLGAISSEESTWLIEAESIKATYDPGKMLYEIRDPVLEGITLYLEVLALREREGLIFRFRSGETSTLTKVLLAFGGASDERFSREGDIGADPESVFYLEAEHCLGNRFELSDGTFVLNYPSRERSAKGERKQLSGVFPETGDWQLGDADKQADPRQLRASRAEAHPVLTALVPLDGEWQYGLILMEPASELSRADLPELFMRADEQRNSIARRVKITTPDPYLNTLGGALAIAADAIWEEPAFHHGAIAWRQQLVGWRGAYTADPLGWHDRGRTHFAAYARSQLTAPASGPVVPDTSRNLARQVEEIGTAVFTEGYISRYPGGDRLRAHHYDMNQVYIDALLRHLDWTGDLSFAREMWPVITRHLAWEKRCFDTDGDGLYDAYASIWASDAVQYSGGGVTHASAYHYYSNTRAAELAKLLGEDPAPYVREANHIKTALNDQLWLNKRGTFAEFKDLLGLRSLHESPAIWTVYHTLDSEVATPFQQYQLLDYVQREIPRIPIRAAGLGDTSLYTISTTNWLPYTWSVNNVALAEVMHTSLAFWQGHRADEAFLLWKSALVESMYLGASPGSLQQLSFYDAVRGELYRDFADPIGMVTRSLVEGLFGIRPDLLARDLLITPGFPSDWEHAAIELPDVDLAFARSKDADRYTVTSRFPGLDRLRIEVSPRRPIRQVRVNGQPVTWQVLSTGVGGARVQVNVPAEPKTKVEISYRSGEWGTMQSAAPAVAGQTYTVRGGELELRKIYDPQSVWDSVAIVTDRISGTLASTVGEATFFVSVAQNDLEWWVPVSFSTLPAISLEATTGPAPDSSYWKVSNHSGIRQDITVYGGAGKSRPLKRLILDSTDTLTHLALASNGRATGTSRVHLLSETGLTAEGETTDWSVSSTSASHYETIDLIGAYNAAVTEIFTPQYWSPRPEGPTLQLPVTGIGNWCYPNVEVNIDDSGLRARAGADRLIELPSGVPFLLGDTSRHENIVFTSRWDRYPNEVSINLEGSADHLYFLLAGSTNPMQSRLDNGELEVTYTDGTSARLLLRNPDNWVPIEQDYYLDGYAFRAEGPRPPRLHLKSGLIAEKVTDYITIKGFSETGIDGGAATVLDLPLDPAKRLQSLTLRTLANDVVIGIMAATLSRPN